MDFDFTVDLSKYWDSLASGEVSVSFTADTTEYNGVTLVHFESDKTTYDFSCDFNVDSDSYVENTTGLELSSLEVVLYDIDDEWTLGGIAATWLKISTDEYYLIWLQLADKYLANGMFDVEEGGLVFGATSTYVDYTVPDSSYGDILLADADRVVLGSSQPTATPIPSTCLLLLSGLLAVLGENRRRNLR
jgi:hypothetical protein